MDIEQRNISEIKPYDRNPRANDAGVDAVAASIQQFGFLQPILIDETDTIVCGHTRYKAALKLGMDKLPVRVLVGLTPEQIRAFRIADNRTADLADWDLDLLPSELAELDAMGFDLTTIGFSDEELARLLNEDLVEGHTDPDDVPDPPDEPITKPGDLWILGDHRLLCGDSGKAEHVDRLLDGAKIQLVNTDPPYNVNVNPRSNNAFAAGVSDGMPMPAQGANFGSWNPKKETVGTHSRSDRTATTGKMRPKDRPLVNDFVTDEQFVKLLAAWFGNMARVLEPGRGFYIWGGYANCANYPPALKAAELYFSQAVIWVKEHPVLTRKDFMGNHEWCFYGWREGAAHKWFGPNNAVDTWQIKKISPNKMIHLTEKPVELALRALEYSSRKGENVLDLFGGSGSTLIACQQAGRKCFMMELDPAYMDVIVDRFQRFTGTQAVLESDGSSPIPMPEA